MTVTPRYILDLAVDCGLHTLEVAQEYFHEFGEHLDTPEDDLVTSALIDRGVLTSYQVAVLRDGLEHPLVFGKNIVLDAIGSGGMGHVLLAQHRTMNRHVAIKVLHPHLVHDEEAIGRFQREVQAVAKLNHPNIVTAYDADEVDGHHYLVMEFVEGADLSRVAGAQTLKPVTVLDYFRQAATGLAYAHDRGIVHRDIKPANMLVTNEGVVKVLDMGIARVMETQDSDKTEIHLTQAGMAMGTVDFMAPEQAINTSGADHLCDIYSLGCSLFYLLTGRPAYGGNSVLEKILAHRDQETPTVDKFNSQVPTYVSDLCFQMMAKDPKERPRSMEVVISLLTDCLVAMQNNSESIILRSANGSADGSFNEKEPSVIVVEPFDPPTTHEMAFESSETVVELLAAYVDGRGSHDCYIDKQEENDIYRKGGDEGLAAEQVREYLHGQCEENNWTLYSVLVSELEAEFTSDAEAITRRRFNEIVRSATRQKMPRKEAIEVCLTIMLDAGIDPAIEEGSNQAWFDDLLGNYGLG